jgi:hypothetical protein
LVAVSGTAALFLTKGAEYTSWIAATIGLLGLLYPVFAWANSSRAEVPRGPEQNTFISDTLEDLRARLRSIEVHKLTSLPVRWSVVTGVESDLRGTLGSEGNVRVKRALWQGSSSEIERFASDFRNSRYRRLVILGDSGTGKSTLVLLLAVELLESPSADGLIPLIIPARLLSLRNSSLSTEFPTALREYLWQYVPGFQGIRGAAQADELVRSRRVLPIIDGFDELSETLQIRLLRGMNRSIEPGEPFVLVSRKGAYEKAVQIVGTPLNAIAVQSNPLEPTEVADYLERTAHVSHLPGCRKLTAVLREEPDGAVSAALSTPLMVWLAGIAVRAPVRSDSPLLANGGATRSSVESFLLGGLIDAVVRGSGSDKPVKFRRTLERSLAYLTWHLRSRRTKQFTWWYQGPTVNAQDAAFVGVAGIYCVINILFLSFAAIVVGVATGAPVNQAFVVIAAVGVIVHVAPGIFCDQYASGLFVGVPAVGLTVVLAWLSAELWGAPGAAITALLATALVRGMSRALFSFSVLVMHRGAFLRTGLYRLKPGVKKYLFATASATLIICASVTLASSIRLKFGTLPDVVVGSVGGVLALFGSVILGRVAERTAADRHGPTERSGALSTFVEHRRATIFRLTVTVIPAALAGGIVVGFALSEWELGLVVSGFIALTPAWRWTTGGTAWRIKTEYRVDPWIVYLHQVWHRQIPFGFMDSMEAARKVGLVREVGNSLQFRHDLVEAYFARTHIRPEALESIEDFDPP